MLDVDICTSHWQFKQMEINCFELFYVNGIAVDIINYGAVIIVKDIRKINCRNCFVAEYLYTPCFQLIYNFIARLSWNR